MDSRLANKQGVKLSVVERAIGSVDRDAAPAYKDTATALQKFLNTDD